MKSIILRKYPRPWKATKSKHGNSQIVDANGKQVAIGGSNQSASHRALARFIVDSVNLAIPKPQAQREVNR